MALQEPSPLTKPSCEGVMDIWGYFDGRKAVPLFDVEITRLQKSLEHNSQFRRQLVDNLLKKHWKEAVRISGTI